MSIQPAVLSGLEFRRESTVEQLARALRERILGGELPQGAPLRELAIASAARVSRNTVRDTIRRLVHEGLVRHHPHRGAHVTRLTLDDVRDICRVRRVLELAAVDASVTRDPADFDGLRESVDDLEGAAAARDWRQLVEHDLLFHRRLIELIRSDRLTRLYLTTEGELRLCFSLISYHEREHEQPEALVDSHRELLAGLVNRQPASCRRQLLKHLKLFEELLIDLIGVTDTWGGRSGASTTQG